MLSGEIALNNNHYYYYHSYVVSHCTPLRNFENCSENIIPRITRSKNDFLVTNRL